MSERIALRLLHPDGRWVEFRYVVSGFDEACSAMDAARDALDTCAQRDGTRRGTDNDVEETK